MITSATLVAAILAQADAPPAPYPLVRVLDAAREACVRRPAGDFDRHFTSIGWEPYTPPPGWFAEYAHRNELDGGGISTVTRTYRRVVSGRELLVFVVELSLKLAPQATSFSCEVFDPEAQEVEASLVRRWAGRRPKVTSHANESWFFARWEPGLGRATDETSITFASALREPSVAKLRPGLAYTALGHSKGKK